jgi:dihydropteroate synthase
MGVLNLTPDSFSDGGLWLDPERAVAHALEMEAAGAAVIDVGGESTRPGSEPVGEDEELRRVVPVDVPTGREAAIAGVEPVAGIGRPPGWFTLKPSAAAS